MTGIADHVQAKADRQAGVKPHFLNLEVIEAEIVWVLR